MASSWHTLCRAAMMRLEDDRIEVWLETGRRQVVQVQEHEAAYQLLSVVARAAIVAELENPSLMAWQRNRGAALVGFRVDNKGRMIAECWVPKAGISSDEFQCHVLTLAVEGDRFEHQLTGTDVQ